MKVKLDKVKDLTCNKCETLEQKIIELDRVLKKYDKGQLGLENFLTKQKYFNDKSGLEYSKFNKPSTIKIIFVKARNKFNNVESRKMQVESHPKRTYIKDNSYVSKDNNLFKFIYFSCNCKYHTSNASYIRNIRVPSGNYVWVEKRTNPRGPKKNRIP